LETYKLHRQPAVGDEQEAVLFELFQPDTGGSLVSVATVDWSEADPAILQPDPSGNPEVKYWHCAVADETKAFKVVPQTAIEISRKDEHLMPARPAEPGGLTVFVYTADAGMGVVSGVKFAAVPKGGSVVAAGAKTIVQERSTSSDALGYASLPLPADAGLFTLSLGRHRASIDTAGKSNLVVNFKDFI
jgi:hypothetical protein